MSALILAALAVTREELDRTVRSRGEVPRAQLLRARLMALEEGLP